MKNLNLHPKIQELKNRAPAINYRAISVDQFGKLVKDREAKLDQGIVSGYLMIWGNINAFREIPMKGCCAKSISENGPKSNSNYKIKFLYNHDDYEPLALFDVLEEDNTGLYFETRKLDDVECAKDTLTRLRSGTLNNFSPGFNYVWDKMEYDPNQDAIIIHEMELLEGSVVAIPADKGTFAYRSAVHEEDLSESIEDFISTLPRKYKLQARKLFARQTSLINEIEPIEQRKISLESDEPIDYGYLLNNLKIFEK